MPRRVSRVAVQTQGAQLEHKAYFGCRPRFRGANSRQQFLGLEWFDMYRPRRDPASMRSQLSECGNTRICTKLVLLRKWISSTPSRSGDADPADNAYSLYQRAERATSGSSHVHNVVMAPQLVLWAAPDRVRLQLTGFSLCGQCRVRRCAGVHRPNIAPILSQPYAPVPRLDLASTMQPQISNTNDEKVLSYAVSYETEGMLNLLRTKGLARYR